MVRRFDTTIIQSLQSIRATWFGKLMVVSTTVGYPSPLITMVLLTTAVVAIWGGSRLTGAFVFTGILMLVYNALKLLFNRPRPDTAYAATQQSSSFPSGHAADSVAFFGLIGYLLAVSLPGSYNIIGYIIGITVPFLIGISRIYLGAHYPTDVLGGWTIATLGLIATIKLFGL